MTDSIFSVTIQENINTRDLLEGIKDAAQAKGWTISQFSKACTWADTGGGYYDFVVGVEGSLILESGGYGAQTLHYRLRAIEDTSSSISDWIYLGAQNDANKALNHATATHPTYQNNWNNRNSNTPKNSVPRTIARAWHFATENFITSVIQCDSGFCEELCFGSPELIDSTEDEGNFCGWMDPVSDKWYNKQLREAFGRYQGSIYYNGARTEDNKYYPNMYSNYYNGSEFQGKFAKYWEQLNVKNAYSDVRPMFKPICYLKHIDDKWRILGTLPVYRIHFDGFRMGEKITLGSKQFYVFPNNNISWKAGFAIRSNNGYS